VDAVALKLRLLVGLATETASPHPLPIRLLWPVGRSVIVGDLRPNGVGNRTDLESRTWAAGAANYRESRTAADSHGQLTRKVSSGLRASAGRRITRTVSRTEEVACSSMRVGRSVAVTGRPIQGRLRVSSGQ
jgi:hypothetical protein